MTSPVVDFYRAKERAAKVAADELARAVNAGQSDLLPALEIAQDTHAHWRKLREGFEREEDDTTND